MRGVDQRDLLTLRVKGFTPQTLPLKRLLAYLEALTSVLGEAKKLHLLRVNQGSAAPLLLLDPAARDPIYLRLDSVGRSDAPEELDRSVAYLNDLLAEDKASAALSNARGDRLLDLPGRVARSAPTYVVREHGVIRGVLMSIGGRDETVPMLLHTEAGQYQRCWTTRQLSRSLIQYYEQEIEVAGDGKWTRDRDGVWTLDDFQVKSFESMDGRLGLIDTLDRMGKLGGNEWNSLKDPIRVLLEERHGEPPGSSSS